ncbi:MAG: helix-turn-helix transcriptional regulator [Clostridiales bacterium]|nr:helix-turn-helix transcriptional regulator [Clostridiales bacterium]
MDQAKAGAFIALLRKEVGLTQEQPGQKLGVTNKTVSRWERGNYMPDLDTCLMLSEMFGVTINELLCGQRLSDSAMRETANTVLAEAVRSQAFSLTERTRYWKRKWLREHWLQIVLCAAAVAGLIIAVYLLPDFPDKWKPLAFGMVSLAGVCISSGLHNRMMGYVEAKLFGNPTPRQQ